LPEKRPVASTETVELVGHIVDSLLLAKVLDTIVDAGADYRIVQFEMGRTAVDHSRARIDVTADDDEAMGRLLEELQVHGVNLLTQGDATLVDADVDGVLPEGFYSTTNLPTQVRAGGRWLDVANPEMDCAIVVHPDGRVRTEPMHRVVRGDRVVVGFDGVRVTAPEKPRGQTPFEFMSSEVSSEKPKALLVARVAERVREAKEVGGKVLAVCGPAVIHTGAGPDLARLVRERWVDVLFAGNGFAAHDLESNVLGTSLGVSIH
jgi:lysine-ketoglutarate reductase/saccharopine dehydrogenase-like protein (TIGR00300 family)